MVAIREHDFLLKAYRAAVVSGHCWPEFAACEACVDSAFGESRLASQFDNIFAHKADREGPNVIALSTKQFVDGAWVDVSSYWKIFPSFVASFEERAKTLKNESRYKKALAARNGSTYLREVSAVWNTNPMRASSSMQIWMKHRLHFSSECFDPAASCSSV